MNRKRLLSMLENLELSSNMREYLISLIRLEISPFEDEELLSKVEINSIITEILKYNLQIKSIESVTYDYEKSRNKLLIQKGPIFSIDIIDDLKKYNLIGINFDNEIGITINNRKNSKELIKEKEKKIKELEDYYYNNYYIYFGYMNSPEDLADIERVKKEKEQLEREILELEYIEDNSSLPRLDDLILDGLSIKQDTDDLVSQERIYETRKIKELGKIKVYKRQVRR